MKTRFFNVLFNLTHAKIIISFTNLRFLSSRVTNINNISICLCMSFLLRTNCPKKRPLTCLELLTGLFLLCYRLFCVFFVVFRKTTGVKQNEIVTFPFWVVYILITKTFGLFLKHFSLLRRLWHHFRRGTNT